MERITQKKLAQLLHVSQTTVSRVVNDSPLLRDKTKKKILAHIKKFNYVPNTQAKALRGGKTNTVALVLPYFNYLEGYNTARIVSGIGTVANEDNYHLIVTSFSEMPPAPRILERMVQERKLDGLFLNLDITPLSSHLISFIKKSEIPCIFVNSNRPERNLYSVGSENFLGVYQATEYLLKKGYRKVIFVGNVLGILSSCERGAGYQQALRDNKISFSRVIKMDIYQGENLIEFGYETALRIMKNSERPDAFVCYADHIAIGILKAVSVLGFKVPKDVGVVGFGNLKESSYTIPGLTTIQEDGFQIGKTAMEMMLGLIDGKQPRTNRILINTKFIVRDSVILPPVRHSPCIFT